MALVEMVHAVQYSPGSSGDRRRLALPKEAVPSSVSLGMFLPGWRHKASLVFSYGRAHAAEFQSSKTFLSHRSQNDFSRNWVSQPATVDRYHVARVLGSVEAVAAVYADDEGSEFWTVLNPYTPETREEVFNREAELLDEFTKQKPEPTVDFRVLSIEHEEAIVRSLSMVFARADRR